MKIKTLISLMAIASVLSSSAIPLGASGQVPPGKLGYGFAPGLVPGKDFVPNQLIVGLQPGVRKPVLTQAISVLGGQVREEILGEALLIQFPDERSAMAAVNSLAARQDVKFVERNGIVRLPPQPRLNLTNTARESAPTARFSR